MIKKRKHTNFLMALMLIVPFMVLSAQSSWDTSFYKTITIEGFRDFKPFHQTIDIDNFDIRMANAAVYYCTNEIRNKKRLTVLPYHIFLETAAFYHSKDMAEKQYFSHYNRKVKDRREPTDRARLAGISNAFTAENITEGFVLDYSNNKQVYLRGKGAFSYKEDGEKLQPLTYLQLADNLLDAWMHSPPHKENILSKKSLYLGCGVALYIDHKFNDMPMVKATQLFQLYEKIKPGKVVDKF